MRNFTIALLTVVFTLTHCTFEIEKPEYYSDSLPEHNVAYMQLGFQYECTSEPFWMEDAEWCDYFGDSPCCTWYVGHGCAEEWCDWAGNDCWEFELQWCEY